MTEVPCLYSVNLRRLLFVPLSTGLWTNYCPIFFSWDLVDVCRKIPLNSEADANHAVDGRLD